MSDPAPVSRSAQRHLNLIRYREETLARYQHDPAVTDWLNQFRGTDAQRFLERYADERASALVDGHSFWELARKEESRLEQEAVERLWEIQQRKLFVLQCRWRAEELSLPASQVELTYDFEIWGARIEECRLVPPIEAAEVESYVTFLLSEACADAASQFDRPRGWQDYERYRRYLLLQAEGQDPKQVRRNAAERPRAGLGGLAAMLDDFFLVYPDWYAYCDELAGPPNLVLYLPDHRGTKEEWYRFIGHTGKLPDPYANDEAEADDEPEAAGPPAAAPALRTLDYREFDALTDTLMRAFEPTELLRFHEAVTHEPAVASVRPTALDEDSGPEDEDDEDETQEALNEQGREAGRVLREIPELLPVAAHADWRVALHHTWLNWRKQRLAAALRAAFAAYEARQQAGAPHLSPYERSREMRKLLTETRKTLRKQILKGRGVAGESKNLDF
jgi:hypothetical protein